MTSCGARSPSPNPRPAGSCSPEQVRIESFCIDRYEDYVVELDDNGRERPHSPYEVVGTQRIRAKVAEGVVPQAYISQVQARAACVEAGKRLCKPQEYMRACRGPNKQDAYPYGGLKRRPGACNEGKGSFIAKAYGQDFSKRTYEEFNDPKLDQMPGGLAPTGAFPRCASPEGVYDLVGNLHEWVEEEVKGHGRFRGGWYGDAENNGPGCLYVTSAHEPTYHDYSTGFRCCADPASGP
jgi:formylglycine-generating enzyme required for sulfatase activity